MKVLLVGNISGIAISNRDIYVRDAAIMENMGIDAVNPLLNDSESPRSSESIMDDYIHLLAESDAIMLLEGWDSCSYSRLLKVIAEEFEKKVFYRDQLNITDEMTGVERIKLAVELVTGRKFDAYTTPDRDRDYFFVRMIISRYLASQCGLKPRNIASVIMRERSTILYYLNRYDEELKYTPSFRKLVGKFDKILNISVSV